MKRRNLGKKFALLVLVLGSLVAAQSASAQTLLVDGCDGTHGGASVHLCGAIDVTTYRMPFGCTTLGDFVDRTNFLFTLSQGNVTTTAVRGAFGSMDGKVTVPSLDRVNAFSPGASFFGSDVISNRNFATGGGLRMTTRLRLQSGTPGGLVAAPFLCDLQRKSPPGTLLRDEIDHEILTSNARSAGLDHGSRFELESV